MKWTTKNGTKIKISEMTDSHLVNAINFLKNKLSERPAEGVYLGDSDHAEAMVEQENRYNEELSEYIIYKIGILTKEANKRGLKL